MFAPATGSSRSIVRQVRRRSENAPASMNDPVQFSTRLVCAGVLFS
jgi:hypothetical protein